MTPEEALGKLNQRLQWIADKAWGGGYFMDELARLLSDVAPNGVLGRALAQEALVEEQPNEPQELKCSDYRCHACHPREVQE